MARSRYDLTEAKIASWARQGRGQGRGASYRPWLTIEDVPSHGLTSRVTSVTSKRMHTLFSKIELAAFLEADWDVGVHDVREQYPLPRPDTIAIAEATRVRHPRVGSVDVVMTTDLLLDVSASAAAPAGLVAIACKPAAKLEEDRVLEKLEIERRYWARRRVPYRIVTERDVDEARVLTLTNLADKRSFEGTLEPRPGYWTDVCGRVLAALPSDADVTLASFMASLEAAHGWSRGDGLTALFHLAANRIVPIDLAAPFEPRGPVAQVRAPVAAAVRPAGAAAA